MEKVLVLVGQTAVGKTSLSIHLAKQLNGEIINGDAFQVYREFNILTDKIQDFEMGNIPHHLLNIKSIHENYSVKEHQENIRKKIHEISLKGKLPIIVGGTGFYIKAALYDYQFETENEDHLQIEEKYKNFTNEELYQILKKIDKDATKTIHINNRRRVLRAIEIYENTGKAKSTIISTQQHKLLYDAIIINLELEKDCINEKIDQRIDEMFEKGIVDEILNNQTTTTASKAIGYPEITQYLNQEISLNEAKNLMKIHTHQYAKRQRTWYRNQFQAYSIYNNDLAIKKIMEIISFKWS